MCPTKSTVAGVETGPLHQGAVLAAGGHRLLDEDVQAGRRAGGDDVGVQGVRGVDDDGVDQSGPDQVAVIGEGSGVQAPRHVPRGVGVDVADRAHAHPGDGGRGLGVQQADGARADQSEPYVSHEDVSLRRGGWAERPAAAPQDCRMMMSGRSRRRRRGRDGSDSRSRSAWAAARPSWCLGARRRSAARRPGRPSRRRTRRVRDRRAGAARLAGRRSPGEWPDGHRSTRPRWPRRPGGSPGTGRPSRGSIPPSGPGTRRGRHRTRPRPRRNPWRPAPTSDSGTVGPAPGPGARGSGDGGRRRRQPASWWEQTYSFASPREVSRRSIRMAGTGRAARRARYWSAGSGPVRVGTASRPSTPASSMSWRSLFSRSWS